LLSARNCEASTSVAKQQPRKHATVPQPSTSNGSNAAIEEEFTAVFSARSVPRLTQDSVAKEIIVVSLDKLGINTNLLAVHRQS
jgi:hypothetical protein